MVSPTMVLPYPSLSLDMLDHRARPGDIHVGVDSSVDVLNLV